MLARATSLLGVAQSAQGGLLFAGDGCLPRFHAAFPVGRDVTRENLPQARSHGRLLLSDVGLLAGIGAHFLAEARWAVENRLVSYA